MEINAVRCLLGESLGRSHEFVGLRALRAAVGEEVTSVRGLHFEAACFRLELRDDLSLYMSLRNGSGTTCVDNGARQWVLGRVRKLICVGESTLGA